MLIIPAIDIKGGRCVRLRQGRMDEETVYCEDPCEVALRWQSDGARLLHIVDLDGAIAGSPKNYAAIEKITASIKIPVQIGGGIRDLETAETYLKKDGVERVILGTSACLDPGFLKDLAGRYPERIAAGIDAKGGKVAIRGWTEVSDMDAHELARTLEDSGISCIIYTDIARDGMLTGPNIRAVKALASSVNIPVIASGGVSRMEDIPALEKTGVRGVIIGKALYYGAINLKEAVERFKDD